jgi:hypothetical protein
LLSALYREGLNQENRNRGKETNGERLISFKIVKPLLAFFSLAVDDDNAFLKVNYKETQQKEENVQVTFFLKLTSQYPCTIQ